MLTAKDVASRLNISLGAVYKAIQNGALEHHRFGSTIRITEDQLQEYLEKTRAGNEEQPFKLKRFKHL